jgi:glycosyltransferase involved in cell wall biosynthesis
VGVVADAGVSRGGRPYTVARAGGEPFPTFLVRHRWGPAHAAGVLSGLRRLSREGLRPGVVHGHVHQAGLAALLAGRRYRVPVVISEHSSHFSLGTLSAAARRQAKVAFRGADLVCPVSEHLKRRIEAAGVQARFRVVPNPVDTDLFVPSEPPEGPPTALFVGGLNEVKRADLLLRALARTQAPELRLELIGDGPLRPRLERQAEELGVAERVAFRGYQPRTAIAERLRGSSFLVVPSATETFGLAAAEALASGRPVVASRAGALPEVVDDGNGILVPSGDEAALARALDRMAEEHAQFDWQALAAGAHERYGMEPVGRLWAEIYDALSAH